MRWKRLSVPPYHEAEPVPLDIHQVGDVVSSDLA